jgi:hypothetical protein
MKSLLENLRESLQVNEDCGGALYYTTHHNDAYYETETYRKNEKEREREMAEKGLKALDEIPEKTVLEYISLVRERIMLVFDMRVDKNSRKSVKDRVIRLQKTFDESLYKLLGIENISIILNRIIQQRTSVCRTGTQTTNVLKMIALMLSEEYSKNNMNDPKLEKAFKKITAEI